MLDIHTHKQEAGLGGKAIVNYRLSEAPPFAEGCCYSVGVHPWQLAEADAGRQLQMLAHRLPHKQIVAIGEAGLDKLAAAPMEIQAKAFAAQVHLSETYRLPLIIHCVKAMEQLLAIKKQLRPLQPWIWHGFRGKPQQAAQLLRQGFYLSLGEHYPPETMRLIPDDRLFLETDESPLDIGEIIRHAAQVRGVEAETLRAVLRRNIQNLFFKA